MLRQRHIEKADVFVKQVASPLLIDHDPILLLHSIAAALIKTGCVRLPGTGVIGIVQRLAKDKPRSSTGSSDEGITFAQFVGGQTACPDGNHIGHSTVYPCTTREEETGDD